MRPGQTVSVVASHSNGGFALAFLLWMLAAMSLLVSGVVMLARSDVQLAAQQLDRARAAALGRGAAQLLMREWVLDVGVPGDESGGAFVRQYQLGGYRVVAQLRRATAFVSLNGAAQPLLSSLFQQLGGLSASEADELAHAVVAYRGSGLPAADGSLVGGQAFAVVEDLLRVPGMTRDIYERIRLFVHALPGGSAALDPASVPPGLRFAVAGVEAPSLDAGLERGPQRQPGGAAPGDGFTVASGSAGEYCVDVFVYLDADPVLLQRLWVDGRADAGSLPWSFRRVLPVMALADAAKVEQLQAKWDSNAR